MLVGTDYATARVEVRAQWNRGHGGTLDGLKDIEEALPFLLKGLDADTGGEIMNYGVLDGVGEEGTPSNSRAADRIGKTTTRRWSRRTGRTCGNPPAPRRRAGRTTAAAPA
jgi:hypothetical protein